MGISPEGIVACLMASRGISPDDMAFRSASLSSLSDPLLLGPGADAAASMLGGCRGKDVAVVGDYDADGISASVIAKRTVAMLGGRCSVFLPSRWVHGYGLNDATVAAILSRFSWRKPDMMLVLDCGSSSEKHVAALRSAGVGRIAVIDHHIIDPATATRSADAHVNWRASGHATQLCAAGETMQVCRLSLSRAGLPWEWMLPFAALATVGDAVGVTGDNRVIVRNGADYNRMTDSGSLGLSFLAMKRCRGGVSQKALAFYVVPRINAAGRMDSPDLALEFLLEDDSERAARLLSSIEAVNDERKAVQDRIIRAGVGLVGRDGGQPSFVFLHDPSWNIGVVGISCSQMVERYGVPAMMFGTHGGKVKGSGRSIPGMNIKAILDECGGEVFERWGGHEMACGAVVRGGMFAEARSRFEAAVVRAGGGVAKVHDPEYDFDIPPRAVTRELGNALLETMYPYCQSSNPEPVFRVPGAEVRDVVLSKRGVWRHMEILASKDGERIPIRMATFVRSGIEDDVTELKEGDVADLYFSYPQVAHSEFGFGDDEYALELVDAVRIAT